MLSKNKKKILFRFEAGQKHGLGHLVRCYSLAHALEQLGMLCTFAMQTPLDHVLVQSHTCLSIKNSKHFEQLASDYDVVVIDLYAYTSDELNALSQVCHYLILMDDECKHGRLSVDMIINSAFRAEQLNYQLISNKTQLLLGQQYALLKPEFSENKCILPYEKREKISIIMGGSDVKQLTLPILKKLSHSFLKHEQIMVITGIGCENCDLIEQFCHQYHWSYYHNTNNMAVLMNQSKLAISAAGSTVYELASCGVPMVAAIVADNQWPLAQQLVDFQWYKAIDCRKKNKTAELIQQIEILNNKGALNLLELSHQAKQFIDTQGAGRVAGKIRSAVIS